MTAQSGSGKFAIGHCDWLMMTQDQEKLACLVLVEKNCEEHYCAQLINFKNV